MSMDKAIEHGKEKRKPYTGSKAIDKTCRNHGGCSWCEENRKHKYRKAEEKSKEAGETWLTVDEVRTGDDYIIISWNSNIGFGEYTLYFMDGKWHADSECMDKGNDKNFLNMLLAEFIKNIEVDE